MAMILLSVLGLLAGAAALGLAVARRLGSSEALREWASHTEESARVTLLTLPGGGALLLAAGFVGLSDVWEGAAPLVVVFALIAVPSVLYSALRLPVPLWLFPRWARPARARMRERTREARRRQRAADREG
jgi:hypothetical protein